MDEKSSLRKQTHLEVVEVEVVVATAAAVEETAVVTAVAVDTVTEAVTGSKP